MGNLIEKIFGMLGAVIPWAVALFVAGYFITSPVFDFNEVTVYNRGCSGLDKKMTECISGEEVYSQTSFKVSFETQTVIQKIGPFIESLKGCSVYDKKNWRCGAQSMLDGRYNIFFEDTKESWSEYNQQIPRFLYTYWTTRRMFGL